MKCIICSVEFEGRSDAKFCSPKCRVAHSRKKPSVAQEAQAEFDKGFKEGFGNNDVTPPKLAKVLSPQQIIAKVAKEAKAKPAKVETAKDRKPLLNGMTGEPRLHSGWYFRTDLYRRGVIDAIKADPTLGTIEKSKKHGWIIHRDAAQKAKYDATIPVNRIDGDWVAKFDGEWLTHEQCNAMGIDTEERERLPLYSAA